MSHSPVALLRSEDVVNVSVKYCDPMHHDYVRYSATRAFPKPMSAEFEN